MRISLPLQFRWLGIEYAALDSDASADSSFASRKEFDG